MCSPLTFGYYSRGERREFFQQIHHFYLASNTLDCTLVQHIIIVKGMGLSLCSTTASGCTRPALAFARPKNLQKERQLIHLKSHEPCRFNQQPSLTVRSFFAERHPCETSTASRSCGRVTLVVLALSMICFEETKCEWKVRMCS